MTASSGPMAADATSRGATVPKRRVLHVLKYYRPDFSGEGVFLERSSVAMRALSPDLEHDLLVTETPHPTEPLPLHGGLSKVFYLTRSSCSGLETEWLLVSWFLRNIKHYEAIHFRTHVDWYFIAYLLVRLTGRRMTLSATLDDSLPVLISQYGRTLRPVARRALRLFDNYVCISPKLLGETRSVVPNARRTHHIPCGVSIREVSRDERDRIRGELGATNDTAVLLSVGGLCARKDPLSLVRAMPSILQGGRRAKLVLVGPELEPDYVATLREEIFKLGLAEAIVLAGEKLDPHPYFAAADVFLFASTLEGFGTVVPEAMMHGLPVVARRLPGVNDDFLIDGRTGFSFLDSDQIASHVHRLIDNVDARSELGAAGRELARKLFSMESVASRYLQLYR